MADPHRPIQLGRPDRVMWPSSGDGGGVLLDYEPNVPMGIVGISRLSVRSLEVHVTKEDLMITAPGSTLTARPSDPAARDLLAAVERRMYDAETALHAARQSGVDAWIAAAYDRLHEAIIAHVTTLDRVFPAPARAELSS